MHSETVLPTGNKQTTNHNQRSTDVVSKTSINFIDEREVLSSSLHPTLSKIPLWLRQPIFALHSLRTIPFKLEGTGEDLRATQAKQNVC
ncbi:hypothetical protein TNCV_536101 [Trichonephila clavipes]|nr:hypothetical protein TNCV_536101 [Trichonephila clavipes]